MKKNKSPWPLTAALSVAAACMVAGCSTTDTVSSRFPKLEENIAEARTAGADIYAPEALKSAESKLEAARAAVAANDMAKASALTDEAMADTDYARAKAPTEQAKKDALQLKADIQALREDIQRISAAP